MFNSLKNKIFLIICTGILIFQCSNLTDPFVVENINVLFVSDRDGNNDLFLKDLATNSVRKLTQNPEFDGYPAISQDGTKLAYYSHRERIRYLVVTDLHGHEELIDNMSVTFPPVFSHDGSFIIYGLYTYDIIDLFKFTFNTKEKMRLTIGDRYCSHIDLSYDDSKIVYDGYVRDSLKIYQAIFLYEFGTDTHHRLSRDRGENPRFSPVGNFVLYISDNKITIVSLDDSTDITIIPDLRGCTEAKFSADGHEIFFVDSWIESHIFSYNIDEGLLTELTTQSDYYSDLNISNDGSWIAYQKGRDENAEIFVMRTDGKDVKQITNNSDYDGQPIIITKK
jgi:Tol biopolymer transport system component